MRIRGAGRVGALMGHVIGAVRRRSPHGLVLLYHRIAGPRFDPLLLDVAPAHFDAQLAVLRESARVLPLTEFESLRRRGALPPRAVAVTFDDGYADNLHTAVPLLARHEVPATVFITTGMIGATREFWWDDVERVVAGASVLTGSAPVAGVRWRGEVAAVPLRRPWSLEVRAASAPREQLYRDLFNVLRPMRAPERAAAMATLRAWAGVPDAARESHRALSEAELLDLAGRPGMTIGAHSVSHPPLALLDEAAQRQELAGSRHALERVLARAVPTVAYPFGTRHDVSTATTRAARAAGFDVALANEPGAAWRWSSRWRVPRVLVRDWDAEEFRRRLVEWQDAT